MQSTKEMESSSSPTAQTSPSSVGGGGFTSILSSSRRPAVRLTTEFDSETSLYLHKFSTKLLNNLAKFKFSFRNDAKGQVGDPQFSFISKYLSLNYDIEEQNAVVDASVDLSSNLHLRATRNIKAQQGQVAMVADLAGTAYKFELSSAFPTRGLVRMIIYRYLIHVQVYVLINKPRGTFKFPLGEVSLEEKEEEEDANKILSINGIFKGQFLNGVCTALYKDENLNMRYAYKDEQMTFIPTISLPSNTLTFAFKRQYGPLDKLSYFYDFNSNFWSAVYKHKVGKDYKLKAGYDSENRLGWASLWVGDEAGGSKAAPLKMKVQLMLQVPQDDIKTSTLMFRVKKRWDF